MAHPTRVRAAREDDLAAVRDIVNWAIEHTHYNFNTEPQTLAHWQAEHAAGREHHPWLVAEDDGAVVGVAYAGRYKVRRAYDWTAEVTVYVSHRHHRRGVGAALYGELLPILEAQGFHTLIGVIALPNEASVALHERFGFVATGETARVGWKFGKWWGVGHWQKLLAEESAPATPLLPVDEALRRLGDVRR
jgi:phosphinothricin acetyltransferase